MYSNIKRIDINSTVLISIHPNPVTTVTKLTIQQETDAPGELQIVDAGGSMIYRQELEIRKGINQFDLALGVKLRNGVYQAIILINNKPYIFKLLIKK